MRFASVGLTNTLKNNPSTLCHLWRITLQSGTIQRFTDHPTDVVIPSDGTYLSAFSFSCSAILTCASAANAQSNTFTINMDPGGISELALRLRLYDGAYHEIMAADYLNPVYGTINLFSGTTGQIKLFDKRRCEIEVIPIGTAIGQSIAYETYSLICRNALGDANCGFDINSTAVNFTVSAVSAVNASGTASDVYTSGGLVTDFADGDTITLAARTYTFKTVNTPVIAGVRHPELDGFVHRGGTVAASLVNLARCINDSGGNNGFVTGLSGYDYYSLEPDPLVSAVAGSTTLTVTARAAGALGSTVSASASSLVGAWAHPFLIGGFSGRTITAAALNQAINFWATGYVRWLTGDNAGSLSFVQASIGTSTILSFAQDPLEAIQVGDTGTAFQGCDKAITTCRDKFNLVPNFRGEPFVPMELLEVVPLPIQFRGLAT